MQGLYDEGCLNNLVAVGTTACNPTGPLERGGYGDHFPPQILVNSLMKCYISS